MYNTIFFISTMPFSGVFELPNDTTDIAMDGIADYLTDSMPIPSSFVGTNVLEDGYFRLTDKDIENYFSERFYICKKLFEQAALSNFCEGIKDGIMPIEQIYEKVHEIYVVCNYFPDDLTGCYTMTLDSFLRLVYWKIKHSKETPMYIVGCCGYHS